MPDIIDDDLDLSLCKAVIASAQETIAITDADLSNAAGPRVVSVNPAFERLTGYTGKEATAHRLGHFHSAEIFPQLLDQMRQALKAKKPFDTEIRLRSKEGKAIWIACTVTPVLSRAGQVTSLIHTGIDITAHRRADQEHDATQRLFASVFNLIEQGIAVADDAGRFVMANPAFTRQLGVTVTDLLGRPATKYIDPQSRDVVEQIRGASSKTKRDAPSTARLVRRDGSLVTAEIAPVTVDPREGHNYLFISIPVDRAHDAKPAPEVKPPVAPPPVQAAKPAAQTPSGYVDRPAPDFGRVEFDPAVHEALAKSDNAPPTVVAGKLQLVGLEDVRNALGDKWPALAERTFAAAEMILKRLLGPRDAFSRTDDDGFLVCFSELDERAANFKATMLRKEIRDRLIGESPYLAEMKVSSFVAEVAVPTEGGGDGDVPDFADAVEQRLKVDRQRREIVLRQSFWTDISPENIRIEKVRTNTGQLAPLLRARLPEHLETSLDSLHPNGESELNHEAGMMLLTAVAERVLSGGLSATELIIVPIHIATLMERKSREGWLKVARGLEETGKTRLVLEICGLSKNIGLARLTDLVTRCAPMFRAVAIELPDFDTTLIADLPTAARILTLPARRAFSGQTLNPAFARLVRASSIRMRQLMVKDVTSAAQAKTLVGAGVGLIAGFEFR